MRRDFGVAIGLPEPHGSQLQAWRERLGDPTAHLIPPHVTLLPPTGLREVALEAVEEHLRRVAAASPAFAVQLKGSESFRPVSPVVFVPLVQGAAECARLQSLVRAGPLDRPIGFPYHPHVTVAHDLPDAALDRAEDQLAGYAAEFPVWGFSLFERGPDGVWRPQRDFRFGSGGLPGPDEGPQRAGYPSDRTEG